MKWRATRPDQPLERWMQSVPTWLVATLAVIALLALKILAAVPEIQDQIAPQIQTHHWETISTLLSDVESIAAVIAVILYIKGAPERRAQRNYEAWRVVDMAAAAHMSVSYARYQALEDLHQDGLSLQGLEASHANLPEIELPKADLKHCNLSMANLSQANLSGANLQGADLREANLQHANLRGANLQGSNLQGANLRNAELWEVQWWGADLSDAELWWAEVHIEDLEGACLCRTIMPDGQQLDRDCTNH
ncbi:pentapeptide repeat-containing protein [Leptothoe spongobia]|uniref:Pentapeptide repeat-containing protein n=1 Tax=Leptothoe spongobia TAU-MAC 1115 TaxID=1967444 RepID=A0A947DBR1_9CYAN|nr:pentapeptide repeat-containing protein [Leptothoe spongobia]MBT9314192.1 pentapeptide repeat-containing protein [Leptothoe spongobia TAU-MAC 1115]